MVKKFSKKKKLVKIINSTVLLAVNCTSNNTIIHTKGSNDFNFSVSSGVCGLKGAKRSTLYAAEQTILLVVEKLKEKNIRSVFVFFSGFGKGRRAIIKGLKKKKLRILRIFDKTPISHNGCRKKKKRRL
jgi:small subunit ribosomal protein S11